MDHDDYIPPPPDDQPPAPPGQLRRITRLFRPHRRPLAAVLGLIGVSAALGIVSPFLLRGVLDTAIPDNDTRLLTVLVLGMIVISIATGVLSVGQTYLSNVVGQRVMHDLRAAVYRHLQRLSLAFFTRTRTGEVQSRIANDIGGVQNVVTTTATSIVSNITTVLAVTIAMLVLDWRLALFSLAVLPFFAVVTRRVGNERKRITTQKQGRLADMSSLVEESLSVSGILLGKTMGRGDEMAERFATESRQLAAIEVRSRMAGRWRMATVQMSSAIMPALAYWFAGQSLASGSDAISLGTLVAFTQLQTRALFPTQSLLNIAIDLQTSMALFQRIFAYLDLKVDITEREQPVTLDPDTARGDVAFRDVCFAYDEQAPRPTIDDVSFTVAPGTTTAIVGETGSGKTTLGYLVARLYDASSGSVSIDGVDVRDLSFASLAATVGLVSQETYLFHASIADNLRFARPEATDEQLVTAARAARIHDLVAALPEGYDTVVGERGYRFSGGEKQRIAIARTVLRNPPVLLLDEATSALDNETERAVQEALDQLTCGRTTIAIAHRLSTVRDADQIIVLDHGRIAERGTHDELVAHHGIYRRLAAEAGMVDDVLAGEGSDGGAEKSDGGGASRRDDQLVRP